MTKHPMTNAELRWKIAEALGWTEFEKYGWDKPSPKPLWATKNGVPSMDVPDWPEDVGLAYQLCIDVLDSLNANASNQPWRLEINRDRVAFGRYVRVGNAMLWEHFRAEGRNARALSELAHAALTGAGQ